MPSKNHIQTEKLSLALGWEPLGAVTHGLPIFRIRSRVCQLIGPLGGEQEMIHFFSALKCESVQVSSLQVKVDNSISQLQATPLFWLWEGHTWCDHKPGMSSAYLLLLKWAWSWPTSSSAVPRALRGRFVAMPVPGSEQGSRQEVLVSSCFFFSLADICKKHPAECSVMCCLRRVFSSSFSKYYPPYKCTL